jgi:hypothetical protein
MFQNIDGWVYHKDKHYLDMQHPTTEPLKCSPKDCPLLKFPTVFYLNMLTICYTTGLSTIGFNCSQWWQHTADTLCNATDQLIASVCGGSLYTKSLGTHQC